MTQPTQKSKNPSIPVAHARRPIKTDPVTVKTPSVVFIPGVTNDGDDGKNLSRR